MITWLFDLDNTLHNASHAIFPAINVNMNAYMAQVLGDGETPAESAHVNAVRVAYWQRYGATLLGMIRHHNVRADDFLHAAHRFDNLASMIRAERGLARLLKRLPGRKILLTNAPRRYAHEVVRHLGLHRHFAHHVPIESMWVHRQLRPKPSKLLLKKLLARYRIAPSRTVLVEDTVANLKSAKALGMRTAWITGYLPLDVTASATAHQSHGRGATKLPAGVDVKVKSVRRLPANLARLR